MTAENRSRCDRSPRGLREPQRESPCARPKITAASIALVSELVTIADTHSTTERRGKRGHPLNCRRGDKCLCAGPAARLDHNLWMGKLRKHRGIFRSKYVSQLLSSIRFIAIAAIATSSTPSRSRSDRARKSPRVPARVFAFCTQHGSGGRRVLSEVDLHPDVIAIRANHAEGWTWGVEHQQTHTQKPIKPIARPTVLRQTEQLTRSRGDSHNFMR